MYFSVTFKCNLKLLTVYSCTYSYFCVFAFVTLCLPLPVWVSEAPPGGGPCCVAVNCDGCKEADGQRDSMREREREID